LEKNGTNGIHRSVPDTHPEIGIFHQIDIVVNTDKSLIREKRVFLKKAEPGTVYDRINQQGANQENRGGNQ
jgi:hypothetical protein